MKDFIDIRYYFNLSRAIFNPRILTLSVPNIPKNSFSILAAIKLLFLSSNEYAELDQSLLNSSLVIKLFANLYS